MDSNGEATIKTAFQGEWLVIDLTAGQHLPGQPSYIPGVLYSVAKTRKGALAAYRRRDDEGLDAELNLHDTFEEFSDAEVDGTYVYPRSVVAEVALALGIEYEAVLDI